MDIEPRLKLALDESRLLILGAQVLFGFQFQAVFQEGFRNVAGSVKLAQAAGMMFLLVAMALLIAPSMQHQIRYSGDSRRGALDMATRLCSASLFPLILGLGTSMYIVFAHVFGALAGVIAASLLSFIALSLLYGLGFALRAKMREKVMPMSENATPLRTKIEQLLTEARVIIPGGQALLGFQFVATLTKVFAELPFPVKLIHAAGLCAVALSVVLLMTPAALHRIAYRGEDDASFFRIGSALVVASTLPLALGIACDVFVVFYVVSQSDVVAAAVAFAALSILLAFWLVYPFLQRSAIPRIAGLRG